VKKFIAQYPLLLINKRFFKIAFLFFVLMFFLALQQEPLASSLASHSCTFKSVSSAKIYHCPENLSSVDY